MAAVPTRLAKDDSCSVSIALVSAIRAEDALDTIAEDTSDDNGASEEVDVCRPAPVSASLSVGTVVGCSTELGPFCVSLELDV